MGLPKADAPIIQVYPPHESPYFANRRLKVPVTPGFEPVIFDVVLKRGLWVSGRVTNVKTGEPVAAAVNYFPFLDNPAAGDYPNFDPNSLVLGNVTGRQHRTDRDGRFRVAAIPGRGVITARTDDGSFRVSFGAEAIAADPTARRLQPGQLPTYDRILTNNYQSIQAVDIPPGVQDFPRDLPVDPGGSLLFQLVDAEGRPVTGASIPLGRYPRGGESGSQSLDELTTVRISGLEPGLGRTVLIKQAARGLGVRLNLLADGPSDGREQTVVLRPLATIAGQIVDREGQAVAGEVEVRLTLAGVASPQMRDYRLAHASLDAAGRFRITGLPAGGEYTIRVVQPIDARNPTQGLRPTPFAVQVTPQPGETLDLGTLDIATSKPVLPPPAAPAAPQPQGTATVPIQGRIIDLEGRPVAGVQVTTGLYQTMKLGDLTPWLAAVKQGKPQWFASGPEATDRHEQAPEAARRGATTDADGRFRIEGLDPESILRLTFRGDSIAYAGFDVVTRRIEPFANPASPYQYGPEPDTIRGTDFTFVAAPTRPATGVVKDVETGQPLVGAEIRSYTFAGSNLVGIMPLKTITDEAGRFTLTGLPRGKGNRLLIVPNDDQPYFVQEANVPDSPGAAVAAVEVVLRRGLWIEGKITDGATGQPVANATLGYAPFLDNEFARANPVFRPTRGVDGQGLQDRYKSKTDGSFRLVGLPGRAIVGARQTGVRYLNGVGSEAIAGLQPNGSFNTYFGTIRPGKFAPTAMKEINPPADATVTHVDFEFQTGASVQVRFVDVASQPVIGVLTQGFENSEIGGTRPLATAEVEARNLPRGASRLILAQHPDRKIGKIAAIRAGDDADGPVVVLLEPFATLTGRMLDAAGNPVPATSVETLPILAEGAAVQIPRVGTDADGRFIVPNLPVGCGYDLRVTWGGATAANHRPFASLKGVIVRPGETTNIGEIRFQRRK